MNSGLYFSDVFAVAPETLAAYGAFNISLVNDLPLFVDPFLLFYSDDEAHRAQHNAVLTYLRFLRDHAAGTKATQGNLQAWYMFSEVKQNWLGYSRVGNRGAGLGLNFARALHGNLNEVFSNFGSESITRSSHLEKLCLIQPGVGRDSISDFVTNLIKEYLLRYTETFARAHIEPSRCREFRVKRTRFDYNLGVWVPERFVLPVHDDDFVILTPISLLSRDDTWISHHDLHNQFDEAVESVPNAQLREELNQYLRSQIPKDPAPEDYQLAQSATIRKFPQIIDYYIRLKEDTGDQARRASADQVGEVEQLFVEQVSALVEELSERTGFYRAPPATKDGARVRIAHLKKLVEERGAHRFFYAAGKPVRREQDLHLLYRLIWLATPKSGQDLAPSRSLGSSAASAASGKAPADFKLASNTSLRRSLENQAELYRNADDVPRPIKVIIHFNDSEHSKALGIINDLRLQNCKDIVLIDASGSSETSGRASALGRLSLLVELPKPPWRSPEMQQLCELLVSAYDDAQAIRHLALTAGIDLSHWNGRQAPAPAWHDLLDHTMAQGKLKLLLETVLSDGRVGAYHRHFAPFVDVEVWTE